MICFRCKAPALEGDLFCGKCGAPLAQSGESVCEKVTMATLDSAFIKERLGIVYFKEGRYGEAQEMFETSLKIKPGNPEVREWIRRVKAKLKKAEHSPSIN